MKDLIVNTVVAIPADEESESNKGPRNTKGRPKPKGKK